MAVWQYLKKGLLGVVLPTTDPMFDDGLQVLPGDAGFSTAAVTAAMPTDADSFNYVGPSPAAQA